LKRCRNEKGEKLLTRTQLHNFSACMYVITVVLEYLHRTLDQHIHVEYYTPTDQYINRYISTFVFINPAI